MNFCIYEILYSTEALLGSFSEKRVQGEGFSMVGFLGLKVLSGLAVLRQSLSGVQRGHSGTQGLT